MDHISMLMETEQISFTLSFRNPQTSPAPMTREFNRNRSRQSPDSVAGIWSAIDALQPLEVMDQSREIGCSHHLLPLSSDNDH